MDTIRQKLNLLTEPWLDLDDALLEIALTKTGTPVRASKQKYGFTDYEMLEWLGDVVLELMASLIIVDHVVVPRKYALYTKVGRYRQELVRNTNLFCEMNARNLCDLLRHREEYNPTIKDCADIHESLIGALYYHLHYIKADPMALPYVLHWYRLTFSPDSYLETLLSKRSLPQSPKVDLHLPISKSKNFCSRQKTRLTPAAAKQETGHTSSPVKGSTYSPSGNRPLVVKRQIKTSQARDLPLRQTLLELPEDRLILERAPQLTSLPELPPPSEDEYDYIPENAMVDSEEEDDTFHPYSPEHVEVPEKQLLSGEYNQWPSLRERKLKHPSADEYEYVPENSMVNSGF